MKAAPAACELLAGVEVLKGMNDRQARKVPDDAPTSFVRKRWENLVCTEDGLDRRFYELCVLSELKNSLRSGDIWVQGSRQFKDFEDYLLPPPRFAAQRDQQELGLAVDTDCDRFLKLVLWCCKSNWQESSDWPLPTNCPMQSSPAPGESGLRRWTMPCRMRPKS